MQRLVQIPHWPPRRIISVVPSQTELLADLGLEEEVLGITKFCIHPHEWFENKTRIGGTKTLNIEKIAALNPDLIIGNKEENEREQIEELAARFPVWMSDIHNLDEALDMIRRVGELTDRRLAATALASGIAAEFDNLEASRIYKVAYLIWRKPFMAAGSDTFIQEMLQRAGFQNVFADKTRYPEISAETLNAAQPDLIFLSSEPYPFAEKHISELQHICPAARVMLVDGELFSWYGSRLKASPAYFRQLRAGLK